MQLIPFQLQRDTTREETAMADLTLLDVPESLHAWLKAQAQAHRRSVNQETVSTRACTYGTNLSWPCLASNMESGIFSLQGPSCCGASVTQAIGMLLPVV